MAYETEAKLGKAVSLLNAGITIHVRKDGRKIGPLQISQGGVKWPASPKSKRGPDMTWEQLVKALECVRNS
jgi:hypothetical protein